MGNIARKLDKSDITYLSTLLFFAVIAMFRYFDKKLRKHGAVFEFMEEYPIAILMMFLYFIVLFVFFSVLIANTKVENKKTMYYLTAFLSVFAFPMFLPKYYFGNMDMYVWILCFVSCSIFVSRKYDVLNIVLCGLMGYISPMMVLGCGTMIVVLYLYRYLAENNKKDGIISILNFVGAGVGAGISLFRNGFYADAQSVLSVDRFWISVGLLWPYLLLAFFFFRSVMKKSNKRQLIAWCVVALGVLPMGVANFIIQDYARLLVYGFMYFIVIVISLMGIQVEEALLSMQETKDLIKKYVAIPVLIIVYPLLITTFWIAGPITLYKEKFLGN